MEGIIWNITSLDVRCNVDLLWNGLQFSQGILDFGFYGYLFKSSNNAKEGFELWQMAMLIKDLGPLTR